LREKRGLTQRDLARLVGVECYTIIAQLESGRGRIPPNRYPIWAAALAVEPQEFARRLTASYDRDILLAGMVATPREGETGEAVQPRPSADCAPETD
jgi:transcriptional regulator with XRE-family HTH domain